MKRVLMLVSALLGLVVTLAACGEGTEVTRKVEVTRVVTATPEAPQAAAPRELTALVGSGRDTESINAFLPSMLKIRAGDTITWKVNSDDIHTVTFLSGAPLLDLAVPVPGGGPKDLMFNPKLIFPTRAPGAPVEVYSGAGVVNSAVLSEESGPVAPPNNTFSLVFDTPGAFDFVCQVHPFMRGRVEVAGDPAAPAPSQAQLDTQGEKQLKPLLVELEGLKARRDSGMAVSSDPGPNGTTIWHVGAGGRGMNRAAELYDFLAKDITIAEGDTVVWTSPTFHTVNFHPGREAPADIQGLVFQDQGPPLLVLNPDVWFPAKPSGEFDGTGFFSSGIIGLDSPFGATSFSMTFSKAGSYEYMCGIHQVLGMKGNITVTAR